MATYHENLVQSFENFKDRYIDYEPRNYFPLEGWNIYYENDWVRDVSGITFYISDDGVITATGTSTAEITFPISGKADIETHTGKILSLSGTNLANFGLTVEYYSFDWWEEDYAWLEETVTINDDEDHTIPNYYKARFSLHVSSGVTLDNATLSIMLRDSSVEDNTYYPIAKPNTRLTLAVNALNRKFIDTENDVDDLINKVENSALSFAYTQNDNTATRAYSVGDYIIWYGRLYKVTAAIAQGGTITSYGASKNIQLVTNELSILDGINAKQNANLAINQGTSSVAIQAYAIGDLLVYNDILYKVTAAIARGDTIIDGTNVEETTIANELANVTPQESLKVQTIGRQPKDITDMLDDLSDAIAEQDLEKYGYVIGDWFIGDSGYYYYLADMDPFYANDDFFGYYSHGSKINIHHIGVVVRPPSLTTKYHDTDNDGTFAGYSTSTYHNLLTTTVLDNIKDDYDNLFNDANLATNQGSSSVAIRAYAKGDLLKYNDILYKVTAAIAQGGTITVGTNVAQTAVWSEHLLAHCKQYNTISGWAWSSGTVGSYGGTEYISALTEAQVTGDVSWSNNKYQQGEGFRQLELFRRYILSKALVSNPADSFLLRSLSGNDASVIVDNTPHPTGYWGINTSIQLQIAALILMK